MNKKIKVIELFKRIEKHEDIPKKIKYKDNCYIFKHTNYSIDHLYELLEGYDKTYVGWLEHKDINLFDEVEILEDNTEEIEEIEIDEKGFIHTNIGAWKGRKLDLAFADKINELARAYNKNRKEKE